MDQNIYIVSLYALLIHNGIDVRSMVNSEYNQLQPWKSRVVMPPFSSQLGPPGPFANMD